MGEDRRPDGVDETALEREALAHDASLAAAIGRAGGDLMKGASPVTAKRQAELEIEHFLEDHLRDAEGALLAVLQLRVREGLDLLATRWERPLAALRKLAEHLLASEERLAGFVREVDEHWGRLYSERPHFQRPHQAPHRDDPYTLSSVRQTLSRLLEDLGRAG